METSGYLSNSFDGLHSNDEDDDEMVDIAGATLDFSSSDDVPPLCSGMWFCIQQPLTSGHCVLMSDWQSSGQHQIVLD